CAASCTRLDQLEQAEAGETHVLELACLPGAGEGSLVLAETVVQHCVEVADSADTSALASCDGVLESRLEVVGLTLDAAPRNEQPPRVLHRGAAGRPCDRIGLLDQRPGRRELPRVQVHGGSVTQSQR